MTNKTLIHYPCPQKKRKTTAALPFIAAETRLAIGMDVTRPENRLPAVSISIGLMQGISPQHGEWSF